ncbi:hypothetical protein VMCG_07837 [Cytospora schulzeri]|uniref:Protein kinase domain-containing protein n=1 Tax=Cytospora schulzeri TaxID=448051 RepID=A0A423VZN4_9PEZI|nr:hypothetical protein VMCG_07837 [Valsa malicola]
MSWSIHPLETPLSPSQHGVARLTITKSLATGDSRGAQIVLYVVLRADQDYSREAAAYEYLRNADHTGSFTPAYIGSWTFTLPISFEGQIRRRPVRLVLIEHLAGTCMRDLFVRHGPGQFDALHLSEQYRLSILAILLDGVVRQHHAGLIQGDIAPRNVIIVPPPDETQADGRCPPRVVLIDYNISIIYEMTKYGKLPNQLAKLPENPMQRYWTQSLLNFAGWYPPEWSSNPRLRQKWLLREFGGDKRRLYEPVKEKLELEAPVAPPSA